MGSLLSRVSGRHFYIPKMVLVSLGLSMNVTGRLVAKLKILQGERAQSNLGSEREGVERSKGEEGRIRQALNLSST